MNTQEERMNNGNIYSNLNYTTDLFAKAPINMTDFFFFLISCEPCTPEANKFIAYTVDDEGRFRRKE